MDAEEIVAKRKNGIYTAGERWFKIKNPNYVQCEDRRNCSIRSDPARSGSTHGKRLKKPGPKFTSPVQGLPTDEFGERPFWTKSEQLRFKALAALLVRATPDYVLSSPVLPAFLSIPLQPVFSACPGYLICGAVQTACEMKNQTPLYSIFDRRSQ